jgi:drug/metabolite transporter (DMT)-like permease
MSPSDAPARRGPFDQAWLLMMIPALCWAGNAVVGRAVAGTVPPVGLAFWRWVAGSLLLLPLAWPHLARDLPVMLRQWKPMLALSLFGIAIFNTALYTGAQTTTALNIVMLQTVMPVLIVLASFLLFGERVRRAQAAGIAVSLAGALTLVAHGDPAVLAGFAFNPGDLWMLGACVSYALYTALLRRRPAVNPFSFVVATFVIGAVLLLPLYLAESLSGRPMPLSAPALLAVGYVALFASVLAYLAYNRAVALVGANTAGLAMHLVPVFGTLLAILLLGEVPRAYHAIGIGLIAAGIWLAQRRG